mmetsp:Transcript_27737/g.59250  ORF Transcript_27737/g.59250 Transcript_27737/m.59250 type:complete len:91 (-) Transcript_27737:2206-2478(-)
MACHLLALSSSSSSFKLLPTTTPLSVRLCQSQMPSRSSYQIISRECRPHGPNAHGLYPGQCSVFQSQHVRGHGEEEDGVHVPHELEIFLA